MNRLDAKLRGLGEHLTEDLRLPPYEEIEHRRVRQRRSREAAIAGFALFVVAGVIGVGSVLSGSGAPAGGNPAGTVTVTVPAAVNGELSLRDASFVNESSNAVLGQRCDEQKRCDTVVLSSTDGGRTFGSEHVVTHAGIAGPTKIAVGNGKTLIAYDPGLYLSDDGGESWRVLTPSGYVIKDIATRGKTFTALGVSIDGRAELLQVSVSELGRGSFAHVVIPGADASARLQQDGDGADLVTVGSGSLGSTVPAKILIRAAGSSSWVSVPLPSRCAVPSFSAPKPTSWWLVCADAPTTDGNRFKSAYYSADRGVEWRPLAPPPGIGGGGTVTAVSAAQAYISGPDTPLYVTRDGGASWQEAIGRASAGFGEPHVLAGVSWVVSGSSIWRMDSSGTWQSTALS